MIKNPKVFILGAGASAPYGYPTGSALVQLVCDELSKDTRSFYKSLWELGCKKQDIDNFRISLSHSGKSSVDAFLEHRKEFTEIGKYAIAAALIKFEDEDKIFRIGNWYRYFFEKLNASFDEFDKNAVGIVTFNYDRSLEQYLFTALRNSYGKSEESCVEKLRRLPIIHVHGQIGLLPWQSSSGRPYRQSVISENINQAASGIRIIHEDVDILKDFEFERARKLLEAASVIYFLGFGYHHANVRRLNIPPHKKLVGSAYGLESGERRGIEKLFDKEKNRFLLADSNEDALLFLRRAVDWE